MNLPRRKSVFLHRRILIVFLFSIVLPGAYIGYRGLRSVVQEQGLQRAILLQSLERTLGFEIDKFERTLKESAESSARALVALKSPPTLRVLADFAESRPWIEDVFVYDAHLNLRGPPPFAPKLHLDGKPLVSEQSVREKADVAARFEIEGNYVAAASSYQQLLTEELSLQSKIVLNAYLARAAAEIGDREVVRSAYHAIIQTDTAFRTTQPIVYAAFAWIEIVEDLARQKRGDEALRTLVKFYQRLLDSYPQLSLDQHRYFLQRVHSQIELLTGSPVLAPSLGNILKDLEKRERLLTRALARAAGIESWLQTKEASLYAEGSESKIHHYGLTVEREFIPLTLVGVTSPTLGTQWVAFVVRPDQIEREFLLPALQAGDWAKEFLVSVRQDTSDIPNRHELFNSRMHETACWLPFLKIAVSPRSLSTVEILGIRSPLFVSIGLASLILGVLVLGIFIIYRDIRREEELSMMKSEFISNVSHELKTPIAAIRMLADNLQERRVESDTRRMEYYHLISKESARLSHLIENILDFSRIEEQRKTFRLEKRDIAEIVSETVRQFKSLVEEGARAITLDVPEKFPRVRVDPDALELAVFNLLDNAVKYSERDTTIIVRLYQRDPYACIEVEDHGVGISKQDQERIFEKFYRVVENEGRKIPGSGIGLTLVREIAQAHHGKVEVRSQPGAGSTFQILLPIGD